MIMSMCEQAQETARRPGRTRLALALAGLAIGLGGAARAGDPAQGHKLARQWCASCHIVTPGAGGSDAARPFEAVANDPNVTEAGLRAWLADPHPPMPDLHLTRAEIDAVIAYIRSLRRE